MPAILLKPISERSHAYRMALVLLFFFMFTCACDHALDKDHEKSKAADDISTEARFPDTSPGPAMHAGGFQVTGIGANQLTVTTPRGDTRSIDTRSLHLVKQRRISLDALQTGDWIQIRRAPGQFTPLVIRLAEGDPALVPENERPNPPAGAAMQAGRITGLDPLRVRFQDGAEDIVQVAPDARVFEENPCSVEEVAVGDRMRIFHQKAIVLAGGGMPANRPAFQAAATAQASMISPKPAHFSLPEAPENVSMVGFDADLMAGTMTQPFGFFDPNMLRFDHESWYGDYPRVMNDLGAYWAAFGASFSFNWNLVQSMDQNGRYGTFSWDRYDRLIKHAQAGNIHVIGYIKAGNPQIAGTSGTYRGRQRILPSLPKDLDAYRDYVSTVVERYDMDGKNDMPGLKWPIKHWSIEDEPLVPKYFRGGGADYAVLLKTAYEGVKAADPEAAVICSMIRGTGWITDKNQRTFMEDFFAKLAELGSVRPYDYMDQHWIGKGKNQDYKSYSFYRDLMQDIDQTGQGHGFSPAPYMALEIGGVVDSEKAQAVDLFKRHVILLSLGVEKILWSGLKAAPERSGMRQTGTGNDYFRKVTLLDDQGQKKLAYYTYKLMTDKLAGIDLKNVYHQETEDQVVIMGFVKNSLPVWVIWHEGPDDQDIRMNLAQNWPDIKKVQLFKVVPNAARGADLPDYGTAFTPDLLTVADGSVGFPITEVPVLVLGLK